MASEPNSIANLSIDSLNNDDFLHVNSPVGMNDSLYEIYEKCTTFNFCSFKYSDHDAGDFDNNIDPDNNLYNDIETNCNYYTDNQFDTNMQDIGLLGLSIIHFNARSLNANFVKMYDYLNGLSLNFDIIAISETWIQSDSITEFQINGYELFSVRRKTKGGGGILRKSEKMYYNQLLHEQRDNIKSTWQTLNALIKKSKQSSTYPESFDDNGKCVSDKNVAVNKFNQYFVNVGVDLANKIPVPKQNKSFHDYMPKTNECNLFLSPVLQEDIITAVKNCKSKTSCEHNNIDMVIIKQVINYIAKPLAHVCSTSFEHGVFPDNMKVAKVVPLFKAGDRSVFSNYRPISLLSQFSKILEKLFNERLDKFIDKFQLLNNCQYGFRSQMSTSHALMDLVEEITSSIDAKKISNIGVFIDLKKAFDTVNHTLLIDKLEYYGIRGIAQEWLKSYLKDRKQLVQIDECASTLLNVTCGVPQGSILGPKLFILYIHCK